MSESKFIKARCKKTGLYYGLDVKQYGSTWEVVNMIRLSDDEAKLVASEVRQDSFSTHDNLIACRSCGTRRIGSCSCPKRAMRCSRDMKYKFDCVYCSEFEIDYSRPRGVDAAQFKGGTVTLSQGKEVKVVTFSNVEWSRFDKIQFHERGADAGYAEPRVHVIANEENIEFHGYNISKMDEGVYYEISADDDFEIECDVDTSTIEPHPGGSLYVDFGEITAKITHTGGEFFLFGKSVADVGTRFHMVLSLVDNTYKITIDGKNKGKKSRRRPEAVKVTFGFEHDSHHCHILSHAYMRGIQMRHGVSAGNDQ